MFWTTGVTYKCRSRCIRNRSRYDGSGTYPATKGRHVGLARIPNTAGCCLQIEAWSLKRDVGLILLHPQMTSDRGRNPDEQQRLHTSRWEPGIPYHHYFSSRKAVYLCGCCIEIRRVLNPFGKFGEKDRRCGASQPTQTPLYKMYSESRLKPAKGKHQRWNSAWLPQVSTNY